MSRMVTLFTGQWADLEFDIMCQKAKQMGKTINGEKLTAEDLDFPKIEDGVEGVKFIHAVVESAGNDSGWSII